MWQVFANGKVKRCLPQKSTTTTVITPYALSTRSSRLLVTSCGTRQLLLYNTRDSPARTLKVVQLPRDVVPRHAVETDRDTIVFCHTGPDKRSGLHRVLEVDERGTVIREFGGTDRERVNVPRHLAETGDGHLLVADCYNRRILLLDADLRPVRVLIQRDEGVLPWRLCHSEPDGRLLVGETWLTACVKVFDIY